MTSTSRPVLSLLLAVGLVACSNGKKKDTLSLQDVVPKVDVAGGSTPTVICTALPTVAAGPAATATAPAAVLPGGSSYFGLDGSGTFDEIFVAVQGLDCYWRIPVDPNTSEIVVVTVGQRAPATFNLELGVASGGAAGARDVVPVTLTSVGTGKVQVSVSWDAESDVDLHLVEPGGEEIYYGNDLSAAGGVLDLDSNAACEIDGVKNENITYTQDPPRGEYTVRVDYYDSCTVTSTKYVVTVTVAGASQTFSGEFTGLGDGGGEGDGQTITTFTY